ncbi:MAG: membrane protein insertase YidC [Rugosibacter sp.]|nr:membrane protein insertase YidC [Rugosibacter sp.]
MDNRRLILLLVFSFSLVMLWDGWQKHNAPATQLVSAVKQIGDTPQPSMPSLADVHNPSAPGLPAVTSNGNATPVNPAVKPQTIKVETDLLAVEISTLGGDIVQLDLKKHHSSADKKRAFTLFEEQGRHTYMAQSGLIGEGLPNHRSLWRVVSTSFTLPTDKNELVVQLSSDLPTGEAIVKTYIFHRGSYKIDIQHTGLPKAGFAYYQFTRDGKSVEEQSNPMMVGSSSFTGPAVYTDAEKFQKVTFEKIKDNEAKFVSKADNGWLAMIQHYFVAAWLPPGTVAREFYMRALDNNLYSVGVILPTSADGKSAISLYAGPQEIKNLKLIAPGLDLVVDYGRLTVIAAPLFWVLSVIHGLVGNWGWAIILLTVLIKLAFFPLSAASYKSMAKMRLVTPKLVKLKETYADDRMRLNQEMMALYKKENINPLGGCLPVLIQIPVFIALYWVLLGTVEMRNAPWIGWIQDLSAKDPYYILPLLMGVSMFIQTKLNPAPPDPLQAKVMLMMPIVFTAMFLFFPAGLVLYWTVNNVLSIAQQWKITRTIELASKT